jgi:hypothetical protein
LLVCSALRYDYDGAHVESFSQAGAVGALVAALLAHPNGIKVAENACFALSVLVRNRPGDCATLASAEGGLAAVVAAVDRNTRNADIRQHGGLRCAVQPVGAGGASRCSRGSGRH